MSVCVCVMGWAVLCDLSLKVALDLRRCCLRESSDKLSHFGWLCLFLSKKRNLLAYPLNSKLNPIHLQLSVD